MSNFVKDRSVITKKILEIISPDHSQDEFEIAMITWWVNIRNNGGLGLTDTGYQSFSKAKLENYTFFINNVTPSLFIYALEIDRKLPSPYYLRYIKRDRYITVYDTRVVTMIQLYGNVMDYISTLENLYER